MLKTASPRPQLSATLLARKGQAGPSQLQPHGQSTPPPIPIAGGRRSGHLIPQSAADTPRDKATFRLPAPLLKRLRILAAREGVSQQDLVAAALEAMIEREADARGCLCAADR